MYRSLSAPDMIRIMCLYPAASLDEPIEFDFLYRERAHLLRDPNAGSYDAVSYVWGRPDFTHGIENKEHKAYLKVTARVDTMLRYFRKETKSRYLWIDAICLNQKDEQEKSVQVPLMGDIYRQARKVRIWFGEGDDNAAKILKFLRLFEYLTTNVDDKADADDKHGGSIKSELIKKTMEEIFGSRLLSPLDTFLMNPWFKRRWVLQEAFVNPHTVLHCGKHKLPWIYMISFAFQTHSVAKTLEILPATRAALNVAKALRENEGDLINNLWNLHKAECAYPVDLVFALCGLRPTGQYEQGFFPQTDYSLEWNQVFQQAAEGFYKRGRGHELLLLHVPSFGSLYNTNPSWPSWVPNWSNKRGHVLFISPEYTSQFYPCPARPCSTGSLKGLEVLGICRGEIKDARTLETNDSSNSFILFCQHELQSSWGWSPSGDIVNAITALLKFIIFYSRALQHFVDDLGDIPYEDICHWLSIILAIVQTSNSCKTKYLEEALSFFQQWICYLSLVENSLEYPLDPEERGYSGAHQETTKSDLIAMYRNHLFDNKYRQSTGSKAPSIIQVFLFPKFQALFSHRKVFRTGKPLGNYVDAESATTAAYGCCVGPLDAQVGDFVVELEHKGRLEMSKGREQSCICIIIRRDYGYDNEEVYRVVGSALHDFNDEPTKVMSRNFLII